MASISLRRINRSAVAEWRKNKKTVIITDIFYGLALFLIALSTIGLKGNEDCFFFGIIFGIVGVFTGFISNFGLFRDLHDRQVADITLSMPMTGTERFLSKILSAFYIQIIPALITAIAGGNIFFFFGKNYNHIFETIRESYSFIVVLILLFFALEIFIFALTALCSTCCGTQGEILFFTITLIGLQMFMPFLVVKRIFTDNSGIDWVLHHDMLWNIWGMGLIKIAEHDLQIAISKFLYAFFINFATSVIILIIAGIIYKKRDARIVGTPIANKPFFEIMMFLCVNVIYLVMFYSNASIWAILIAMVSYIIINIIISRKKINAGMIMKWLLKFVATTFVFIAIMLIAIKTNGFGYIDTKPTIDFNNGECEITLYGYNTNKNPKIRQNNEDGTTDEDNFVLTLTGTDLTDEQCRQIMDIYHKYLKKGNINPIDRLMTDNTGYYCELSVYATVPAEKITENNVDGCSIHDNLLDDDEKELLYYQSMMTGSEGDNSAIQQMGDELIELGFLDFY